jgi:hypothetical protein
MEPLCTPDVSQSKALTFWRRRHRGPSIPSRHTRCFGGARSRGPHTSNPLNLPGRGSVRLDHSDPTELLTVKEGGQWHPVVHLHKRALIAHDRVVSDRQRPQRVTDQQTCHIIKLIII